MSDPIAYFLTLTTYGTWLHGKSAGSVDRAHHVPGTPLLASDASVERSARDRLRQPPYLLDEARRAVVLRTLLEVASNRGWHIWAAHVRSNHVHAVVTADATPERVMSDFKAYASRCIRKAFREDGDRDRWTQHGSTRWLNRPDELEACISYTLDQQGEPMAFHDGRKSGF